MDDLGLQPVGGNLGSAGDGQSSVLVNSISDPDLEIDRRSTGQHCSLGIYRLAENRAAARFDEGPG